MTAARINLPHYLTKTVRSHNDLYNVLEGVGVWRADVTESKVGTMLIIVIPLTCPNRDKLERALYMTVPATIQTIVLTKEQNWLKNRKKFTYRWRTV